MVPTLYASFFADGPAIYEKAREVAASQGYVVAAADPQKGLLHLHKKGSGKTVHLIIHLGVKGDRAIAVEVMPGDEGRYMDFGRQFISELKKVVR
jgi:hypothetical protein